MKQQNFDLLADPIKALEEKTGLESRSDLKTFPFIVEHTPLLPYSFVKKKGVIPLQEEKGEILLAISDPFDFETILEVKHLVHKKVREILASKGAIEEAIEICYGQKNDASKIILGLDVDLKEEEAQENFQEYDLLDYESDSTVIRILNTILLEALNEGASDIHFEPVEKGFVTRYRIDGLLQVRHTLSREVQIPLTTRIKVLAQLDIAEHRLPQDGRIKLKIGEREIDFRVSSIPVVFGERVVLRILDRSQLILGLDHLSMRSEIIKTLRREIQRSQGIILVTGPTGSGKTTTLYSMLTEIRSSSMNIMTIEDPVEFKIEGLAQMSVNQKIHLNFATGLRHILRQDPDVIMIGEVRDTETAEIAIQASLTGHLVLSTLHTNDAPSAIARLVDMKIEPYLITSSLIGVLAQRLARRICPQCKIAYHPKDEELMEIGALGEDKKAKFYKGKGCHHCFGTGYKGRIGLYEFMPVTTRIKKQIMESADATLLTRVALEEGMQNLHREALRLIREGETTIEEIVRVIHAQGEEI